jgi:hypothetical protein
VISWIEAARGWKRRIIAVTFERISEHTAAVSSVQRGEYKSCDYIAVRVLVADALVT